MEEVVSVSNMRKSDAYTIENGIPSLELMHKAGLAICRNVIWRGKILIVCGTGNNAGDGYVLAGLLKKGRYDVSVMLLEKRFSKEGKFYFDEYVDGKVPYCVYKGNDLDQYDMIVDCIFGTGFKGEVTGIAKEVIEKINSSGAYIVSADINSGLNGDNGLGDVCVISDLTISIGTLKSGHFLGRAKDVIGRVLNVKIGIDIVDKPYYLFEEDDASSLLGKRDNYSNKGTYGYVTLIGGCTEFGGAVKLANLSACALRSGCGVCRIATPKSVCPSIMPYLLESTLYPLSENDGAIKFEESEIQGVLKNVKSVAIGMGLGQRGDNEQIIEYILNNYDIPVIIDADGLNTLAKMDINILKNTKCKVVLTPHLKEFERLTGVPLKEIENSPIEHAKNYAYKTGTIVLLKGPTTIITDGYEVYLTKTGCAGMASAGSGDVLSGILCATCVDKEYLLPYVCLGAYINGYAGEIAQRWLCDISMLASDTAKSVALAVKALRES